VQQGEDDREQQIQAVETFANMNVLGIALAALIFAVSWLTSVLLNLVGASPQVGSLMLAPVALLLTSVAYSTQYPIYRTVLDPSADVQDAPPATV